jgi:hypothetical protein
MGLRMHGKCRAKIRWRRETAKPGLVETRIRCRTTVHRGRGRGAGRPSAGVSSSQVQRSGPDGAKGNFLKAGPNTTFGRKRRFRGAPTGITTCFLPLLGAGTILIACNRLMRGFGLPLTKGGHKSYVVSCRGAGRKRRMHLKAGLTLSDARGEAKVFALVGPDRKGGSEDMIRRADPLQPCVKHVRVPLRAGAMPLGEGWAPQKGGSLRCG